MVLVYDGYLVDSDDYLTGSRVDDVLDDSLGCRLSNVVDKLFMEVPFADQRLCVLHDMLSNLLTVLLQGVVFSGLLREVLCELLDMLVDLGADFLDNLFHSFLLRFQLLSEMVRYNSVGYVDPLEHHTALGHEDTFFSTDGLSVGLDNPAQYNLELRFVEVASRVSNDRSGGL